MKKTTKRAVKLMIVAGVAALTMTPAYGQYTADVTAGAPGDQKLFLDAAFTTAAPLDSTLWFVADITGNGVPSTGSVLDTTIQSIANSAGDDVRIASGTVPGDFGLFGGPGIFSARFENISSSFASKHIYAFLWNDVNNNSVIGDVGDKYGTQDLGINPPPGLGNATWNIGANMSADQVTVVPEPASFAVVFGFLCMLGALASRKFRK